MPRLLFEKKGNAVWISHLDLMRLFQRAFKRAGLPLTHTKGFNPRPSVSIALPLSVGIESVCELLDFDLDGEQIPCDEICSRLNAVLVDGIQVLSVYENGGKLKNLALMDCCITADYDCGIPEGAEQKLAELFSGGSVIVEKKNKNGITQQNIIPMIRSLSVVRDEEKLLLRARIHCQNPTLNPAQMIQAIERYLPEYAPDHTQICRLEIYDEQETVFR